MIIYPTEGYFINLREQLDLALNIIGLVFLMPYNVLESFSHDPKPLVDFPKGKPESPLEVTAVTYIFKVIIPVLGFSVDEDILSEFLPVCSPDFGVEYRIFGRSEYMDIECRHYD